MKTITREQHLKMLERNCQKGKHRLRTNRYGITWCVICGNLSNGSVMADSLTDEDKLLIQP